MKLVIGAIIKFIPGVVPVGIPSYNKNDLKQNWH